LYSCISLPAYFWSLFPFIVGLNALDQEASFSRHSLLLKANLGHDAKD
jgi:hypothetical protein